MKRKLLAVALAIGLLAFLWRSHSLKAACEIPDDIDSYPKDRQLEIYNEVQGDCQKELVNLADQKSSLKNQISYMNSQIQLTQAKIGQTQSKISLLEAQIDELGRKIGILDTSLNDVSALFINRVVATYKAGQVSSVDLLLSSEKFANFYRRWKYFRVAQLNDRKMLLAMEKMRADYDQRKDEKEVKQAELEELKAQLDAQRNSLAQQKKEKEYLLTVTQNNEKRYQNLLAEARKEIAEIQQAALLLKQSGKSVRVEKEEFIGIQGNTGYSTGDHLHFGVYNYGSIEDLGSNWYYSNYLNPLDYLAGREVSWRSGCGADGTKSVGGGGWIWPMKNLSYVSQGYGYTCHSNALYGGRPHPAIDLVGPINAQIYSVDEGEAYFCRNCLGDGGNGVFVFHPNGKMTMYWHVK